MLHAGLNLSRNTTVDLAPPTLDPAPFFYPSPPARSVGGRSGVCYDRATLSSVLGLGCVAIALPPVGSRAPPPPPRPSALAGPPTLQIKHWLHA